MDRSERSTDEDGSGELLPQLLRQALEDQVDSGASNSLLDSNFPPERRQTNSLLSTASSDKQSAEEKEEDFLIQQTARRFSEAQTRSSTTTLSPANGVNLSSAMFRRMSSQEAPGTTGKPWHDEKHKEHREQMEIEM